MKRAIDFVVASLALMMLAPALALIAGIVRLSGPGPIIYRGLRVGRDGRLFRMLKFRTMRPHASTGGELTVRHDPRVTRLGRLLRAAKLDELPQLVNVLRGEMSLVGPRPESPRYVAHYTPEQVAVLSIRPGMTGPSQVAFRHEEKLLEVPEPEQYYVSVVMPAKLALDLHYVRHHSIGHDVEIMLMTLAALVHTPHVPDLTGGGNDHRHAAFGSTLTEDGARLAGRAHASPEPMPSTKSDENPTAPTLA